MLIQRINKDIFANYSSSIVIPKLVQIEPNLIIALFELMKLIPAKYVIMKAIAENKIDPNNPIVETSSGTYALGMAIVCAELKIPFFIISDPVIDKNLKNRLNDLGGQVQIISSIGNSLDVQLIRLNALNEYLLNNKNSFWPSQYHNSDNMDAYNIFGDYLLDNIGNNFILVAPIGSGSSACGTIQRVRKTNKNIELIGVDTFGSVLFGLVKKERKLRGLGNSIIPRNLIHEYFNQIHWINTELAFKSTRSLHSYKGLFCGPTTGAAYHVAKWIAENNKNKTVVCISPDTGYRYQSTVYNNTWLKTNSIDLTNTFSQPFYASHLTAVKEPWAYFNWGLKSYSEVLGTDNV